MDTIHTQRKFYELLNDSNKLVQFLQEKNLLQKPPTRCPNCHRFNTMVMRQRRKRNSIMSVSTLRNGATDCNVSFMCKKNDCKTCFSSRNSTFFEIKGSHGYNVSKLSIKDIFEILYLWVMETNHCNTVGSTEISEKTVTFWFDRMKEICTQLFQTRSKLGRKGTIIEIDETLLRGKRKNNRGRYLTLDQWQNDPDATYEFDIGEEDTEQEVLSNTSNTDRYKNRIDGPWILGICECSVDDSGRRKLLESRFFIVERRNIDTLIPIILNEVGLGTKVYTDEWLAYGPLSSHGYRHRKINHSIEYVATDGSHTNTVEVVWHHLKTKILRNMCGVPRSKLNSYLIEEWFRSKYSDKWKLFEDILVHIANIFPIVDTNIVN